jgi:hypothetical protein
MNILINLPDNRYNPGTLELLDDAGTVLFGPVACLGKADNQMAAEHNNPARIHTKPFGDTPLDDYAKRGDILPKHSHDFDHGMFVLKGRAKVRTPAGEIMVEQYGAALFRAGREHEIEADEDETVILNEMPA